MIIFKKAADLSAHISTLKTDEKKIGFVPTMGALHAGHLSLVSASNAENDITICSIFINPTQFNNMEDFNNYPVTIDKDVEQLEASGCAILFLPSTAEIYPPDHEKKHYELGELEHILEGYYRPGHFQGVCQVVDRLLSIVQPDRLYLGQKDYQQCMVVKKLKELTGRKELELRFVETKREESGLAMSSRNLRLSAAEKEKATTIAATLNYLKAHWRTQPLEDTKGKAADMLQKEGFKIDYVAIADAEDLSPITHVQDHQKAVGLIAATIGNIRLIDNMLLN